jgi:hypothetical protein
MNEEILAHDPTPIPLSEHRSAKSWQKLSGNQGPFGWRALQSVILNANGKDIWQSRFAMKINRRGNVR